MSLLSSYPNYSNRVHIGWSSICVTAHLSLWNQQADNLCILSSYCSNAQEDGVSNSSTFSVITISDEFGRTKVALFLIRYTAVTERVH